MTFPKMGYFSFFDYLLCGTTLKFSFGEIKIKKKPPDQHLFRSILNTHGNQKQIKFSLHEQLQADDSE